jgi:hypothetical protein
MKFKRVWQQADGEERFTLVGIGLAVMTVLLKILWE